MNITVLRRLFLLGLPLLAAAGLHSAFFGAPRDSPPAAASGGVRRAPAASCAATASAYPPVELVSAASAAGEKMLARLDGSFHAVLQAPFVVIGDLPAAELRRLAEHSVLAPAGAMWRSYFQRKPSEVITVLLLRDAKSYKHWASRLFNDTQPAYFGYYRHADRTMLMNIATGPGTLVHELTHALIAYDFPDVPAWFNEGLASLHEQCYVLPDGIKGAVNWRLPALQQAIRKKALRPLAELVGGADFYGPSQGLNYAQARYFLMYAQQRDLLGKLYRQLRQRGDLSPAELIEEVFGAPIQQVEDEFIKWVMALRWSRR